MTTSGRREVMITSARVVLSHVEWDHPHLGRIDETLCVEHEREVLRALHTLGIGCGGTQESNPVARCSRCGFTVPPRVYLRQGRTS